LDIKEINNLDANMDIWQSKKKEYAIQLEEIQKKRDNSIQILQ